MPIVIVRYLIRLSELFYYFFTVYTVWDIKIVLISISGYSRLT